MKKNAQNKFYTSVSEYYSEIFPYNPAQLDFIKNGVGDLSGLKILDIGCATGELAFQLAVSGSKVTGIDLNENLLDRAKSVRNHLNCTFQSGNMLEITENFQPGQFDVVVCFGNTLVHLDNLEQVKQMFQGVYSILKPGGYFFIQILNYDYILNNQVSELPLIETENIKFIRKYRLKEYPLHIVFQTELLLKKEVKAINNETLLLPLRSNDLRELLIGENFREIEFFSNFKMELFGGNHLPFVVSCKK